MKPETAVGAALYSRRTAHCRRAVADRRRGGGDRRRFGGAGSGLAYRIAEAGYRLNIPRMFAALLLLSVAGIAIFYLLSLINYLALRRWHESALEQER